MRAASCRFVALACLLAACGSGEGGNGPVTEGAPAGAGLMRWPADTTVAVRLPAPAAAAAKKEAFLALAQALGSGESPSAFLYGAEATDGVAPGTTPWAALTAAGGWMRVLRAADMAALRGAFAGIAPDVVAQETEGFLVLCRGTLPGKGDEPPLPEGDLALRVRHHPLLALVAESGDLLEAGIDAGDGGLDVRARLVPGPQSPTAALLLRAVPSAGGVLEFLPPTAFLRIETTLPPVFLAAPVARRLARHAGFPEPKDRVVVERLLREVLSGADPASGLAIGVEARGGELTFVVVARDGDGPASPILRKLRADERSSFGALVLDRRDAPKGLEGWDAWVAQGDPQIEELPECLWGTAGALGDESKGVQVAYAAFSGWSVAAMGPRADQLARATKSRLESGSTRTAAAEELRLLREAGGDYVIGVVIEPALAELPAADLAAVRALFGAAEGASGAKGVAAAGFVAPDGGLDLRVRVAY